MDDKVKVCIALYLAALVTTLCVYLCGYLYEGLINKDWSLRYDDSTTKMFGGTSFFVLLIFGIIVVIAGKIYEIL